MPIHRHSVFLAVAAAFSFAAPSARATDVVVQPSAGSGFVVKDASGASERLRVQETGVVSLPGVVAAPAQSQGLCMGTSGQLGPCGSGTGGTYAAGTGLTLSGTTFSVAPTYQLPQTCTANQIAQWNGTGWTCGAASGGATLPPGHVNNTLRYDANDTLVANELLQAFDNGSLVASGNLNVVDTGFSVSGPGQRLMWLPWKAAFRAGRVLDSKWDLGNIGYYSVAAGYATTASGDSSTAIGDGTTASGGDSTAMGAGTTATGSSGATALGWYSTASGSTAIAMGDHTTAEAENSTAMGYRTHAQGYASTAMGSQTTAAGKNSVAMGSATSADGENSITMGSNVGSGGHFGSFIFGDSSRTTGIVNDANNQFMAIADGGFKLVTSSDGSKGAVLPHNDTAWSALSDRNQKTAVQPVDARDVLKKVAEMPLSTWRYKAPDTTFRHMGPMAQDFYAAFHLGDSDKRISTIDADGVALAAIQGLNAELMERDEKAAERLNALRAEKDREIAALRTELGARVAALESATADMAEMKTQLAGLRRSTAAASVAIALRNP